jgi:hypothetical protein
LPLLVKSKGIVINIKHIIGSNFATFLFLIVLYVLMKKKIKNDIIPIPTTISKIGTSVWLPVFAKM